MRCSKGCSVLKDRIDVVALQLAFARGEALQLDRKDHLDDLAAETLYQTGSRERGAACREQVVDKYDAIALRDGVFVYVHRRPPVLKLVFFAYGLSWELSWFTR